VISFDTRLFGPAPTLLAVEHAARTSGYAVTISSLANLDATSVRSAVAALAGQPVDGAIVVAPREGAAQGLRDLRPGLPLVAVEAGYSGETPVVSVDQFSGARLATEHLLSLGHRTVWHVAGPADWLEARERIEGWRASLADSGAAAPPLLRGESEFLTPSLTTVHQDFDEVGRRGLKLLVEIMEGESERAPQPERVPATLVARQSSAPPTASRSRPAARRGGS
jgi:DNA-binding LacI/PurR family transcriptional regulator